MREEDTPEFQQVLVEAMEAYVTRIRASVRAGGTEITEKQGLLLMGAFGAGYVTAYQAMRRGAS